MQSLAGRVSVLVMLPAAAARSIVDESPSSSSGPHLIAPPIEDANIAIASIFFVVTLLQLVLTGFFVSRARAGSGHRTPGFAIMAALIVIATSYALEIGYLLAEWTVDGFGDATVSNQSFVSIDVAASLFSEWTDPVVFLAVALVLRDRYLAHFTNSAQSPRPALPILPLTIASAAFFSLMFLFSTVHGGILQTALAVLIYGGSSVETYSHRLNMANGFLYTYVAIYIVATGFLVVFTVIVKNLTKTDKITRLTAFVVTPLLALRALARLTFVIFQSRVTLSRGFLIQNIYALDFATGFVQGVLYVTVTGMLVFFLMRPGFWDRTEPRSSSAAQHSGYSMRQQPYHQGGVQPPTQLPSQWDFTGQPSRSPPYAHPAPNAPGANYYPNQNRQMTSSPGDEKVPDTKRHTHATPVTPPTS